MVSEEASADSNNLMSSHLHHWIHQCTPCECPRMSARSSHLWFKFSITGNLSMAGLDEFFLQFAYQTKYLKIRCLVLIWPEVVQFQAPIWVFHKAAMQGFQQWPEYWQFENSHSLFPAIQVGQENVNFQQFDVGLLASQLPSSPAIF